MDRRRSVVVVCLTLALCDSVFSTFSTDGHHDNSDDAINAARCRVRCLSLLQRSMEASGISGVRDSVTLLTCLQQQDCEACLRPCSQPFVSVNVCEEACRLPRYAGECRETCQFLRRVNSIRPGRCPPETRATGLAALCVTACDTDADCDPGPLKCCSNSCGWTCQRALHTYDGVPGIPERPTIRERARGVELKWTAVETTTAGDGGGNDSGPLLYIVDSRWNIGRQQNEADMTPWQQVAQTTLTATHIIDITPGHWYQFRVTAVNIYGSRGASQPTVAFTLSKDPHKPGPPTNLTEGDTLIMGDKVAVTLHWFPPTHSDLPVSRYKLFWTKKPRSSSHSQSTSLREFRQLVPGDQHVFRIPDLEPDTTYFVQVQAICHFGDSRLKSSKASIYVTTYPLPRHHDFHRHRGGGGGRRPPPTNSVRSLPTPSAPVDLTADAPVFHDGVLKANVSWTFEHDRVRGPDIDRIFVFWSPEACIADSMTDDGLSKVVSGNTQENSFEIYDLRFDCRYLVRVQSVTNQGVSGATAHLTVSTPSCHDVTVVGSVTPECPRSAARIPDEPSNLRHSFVIQSSNITASLNWSKAEPSTVVTGYRVVWGRMFRPHDHIMDKATALTKVLPKNVHSLSIGDLQEGVAYLVHVQALSRSGAGRVASIHFTTPILQLVPVDIPYHSRGDDDVNIDTLKYVDAGTVNVVASTLRTARYGETRQMATHVDAAAATLRTTMMSFSSALLLAVTVLQQV